MAEPTSTSTASLVSVGIALFGTVLGPYAVIVFAALAGALYPLASRETASRADGALFLVRVVLSAVVLTGAILWALETWAGWNSPHLIAPVAFAIAMFGNKWPMWAERVAEWFVSLRTGGPR